jgi:hypothetical protein
MAHCKRTSRLLKVYSLTVFSLCLLACCTSWSRAQTPEPGYSISTAGVVVDRAEQWEQWSRPKHAVTIDPQTHTAAPRRIRKNINVIEDMDQFRIKLGDEKEYEKLVKKLDREGANLPLNIVTGPAFVAGAPILYLKADAKNGIEIGDPVTWYFYQGGIREALLHPETAANILDGDPSTYWEPSTEVGEEEYHALPPGKQGPIYYLAKDEAGQEIRVDRDAYERASNSQRRIQYNSRSLEKWYVDVELGRVVPVSKIVLRFADGEVGEPFRQFRILTTPSHSRDASLSLTARTVTPNEDQRVVEFDNLVPNDPNRDHLLIHRLRIQITDSKFDKFKEISQREYLDLPVGDQGGIDYFIVNAVGKETKVDKAVFDQVPAARQSRLAYYQRERPRLADIEVWAQGNNIALGIIEGGGSVELLGPRPATAGFDGLFDTRFKQEIWQIDPRFGDRGTLTIDLGAVFWIDQLRWVGNISSLNDYETRASDGSRDTNGNLKWTQIDLSEKGENRTNYEQLLERPMRVRHLWTRATANYQSVAGGTVPTDGFSEVQVFGEGYSPEVILTSPLIELPGVFVLGGIEWEADIPDRDLVDVEIRTRTGDRLIAITEYYGNGGDLKTEIDYNKLPTKFQGPVITSKIAGGGWSPWSQKYTKPGDPITSPSPRRFLQVQVKLVSQVADMAANIHSVRVNFLSPVARRVLAEIWPNNVPLGTPQDFEVYLNPTFVEREPGGQESRRFDEILIDADPIQTIELLDVSLGSEEDLQNNTEQNFTELGWHSVAGKQNYWFEDAAGARFQALIDPESGDTLKVFQGGIAAGDAAAAGSKLLLHLPHKVGLLPQSEKSRFYNRLILEDGEEVPVDEDGRLLNQLTYLSLTSEQQGRRVHFQIVDSNPDGTPIQEEVSNFQYKSLEDSLKGEILYFRKLIGKGGEFPFDREGQPLEQAAYNALPTDEKGSIVATGEVVRVRFKAKVLLNGSTIDASIRDASGPAIWQQVDAGDATLLRAGNSMSIAVPLSTQVVRDVELSPNPFTPNADGVNDRIQIRFALGNLNADREIRVEIFDLSGRRVWSTVQLGFGEQSVVWQGWDDAGEVVPPGLYLCKIEVDADAVEATHKVDYRVIAVAY